MADDPRPDVRRQPGQGPEYPNPGESKPFPAPGGAGTGTEHDPAKAPAAQPGPHGDKKP